MTPEIEELGRGAPIASGFQSQFVRLAWLVLYISADRCCKLDPAEPVDADEPFISKMPLYVLFMLGTG